MIPKPSLPEANVFIRGNALPGNETKIFKMESRAAEIDTHVDAISHGEGIIYINFF